LVCRLTAGRNYDLHVLVAAASHPHSKLINAAARQALRPLGLQQKGRSRTWLDDQRWWLGVVTFEPSGLSRGSYLMVGVNWLWAPKDHLSFDFGGRVDFIVPGGVHPGQFVEYVNDDQFAPLARLLATTAAAKVIEHRDLFASPTSAAGQLGQVENPYKIPHPIFHAAISSALSGDLARSRQHFETLIQLRDATLSERDLYEWEQRLYRHASALITLLNDPPRLLVRVASDIA